MKFFVAAIITPITAGFMVPAYRSFVSTKLGVAGFTGFGHVTGEFEEKETSPASVFTGFDHAIQATRQTQSTTAPAFTAPKPIFSGFGHATGEKVETYPSSSYAGIDHARNTRLTETASAPAFRAPKPVFSGFGHATGEKVETYPSSSFVDNATRNARLTETASAPAFTAPKSVFSGFGHATGKAVETTPLSSISEKAYAPAYSAPATSFTGFGHALDSTPPSSEEPASPSLGDALTETEKSPLMEAKEFLKQATEKATKLREVMKLKENQNGSRIQELMAELKIQEEACKSYQSQISSITADFEDYKKSTGEEQLVLKEQVAMKNTEINSALSQAKEICDLLDELIQT